jgi:hypothetical protein
MAKLIKVLQVSFLISGMSFFTGMLYMGIFPGMLVPFNGNETVMLAYLGIIWLGSVAMFLLGMHIDVRKS